MKGDTAARFYHGAEGYNCAQSVLKAFEEDVGVSANEIKAAKAFGGGRAKDGVCGAVYGMKRVLGDDSYDSAKAEFEKVADSVYCRQLRTENRITCRDCVRLAADICEKGMK